MRRARRVLALLGLAAAPALAASEAQAPPATPPAAKPLYAEGRVVVLVAPKFPPAALQAGLKGRVDVYATVHTDGSLEGIRIEATPPLEPFESAVMAVAPLWRLQPRIDDRRCQAYETAGHVTIWFDIDKEGKPHVSYGAHVPPGSTPSVIHADRQPVQMVNPLYPASLARNPRAPRSSLQVAYVAVSDDGSVTGITLAPALYYRDFEPLLAAAIRQWKFAPQPSRWCGEIQFNMTLE